MKTITRYQQEKIKKSTHIQTIYQDNSINPLIFFLKKKRIYTVSLVCMRLICFLWSQAATGRVEKKKKGMLLSSHKTTVPVLIIIKETFFYYFYFILMFKKS